MDLVVDAYSAFKFTIAGAFDEYVFQCLTYYSRFNFGFSRNVFIQSCCFQIGFLSTVYLEKRLRAIDKMLEHMEIKMKALDRSTVNCPESDDSSESCSDY